MPEMLWKAYLDYEIEKGEAERARTLYRRLLERTQHPKVWISFAKFEADAGDGADGAAAVFREAEEHFRAEGAKEERVVVLDSWKEMEAALADADRLAVVEAKMPKRIKKKRPITSDEGEQLGWEEYFDYIFPEEEAKAPSLKILEMAHKWKKQKIDE